eukprot:s2950_g4.t1
MKHYAREKAMAHARRIQVLQLPRRLFFYCTTKAARYALRGLFPFRLESRAVGHCRRADTLSTLSSWGLLAAPMFFTLSGFCQSYSKLTGPKADCGVYLLWQYKVCWTPETSNDVHAKVAKRLVECLRRNEGAHAIICKEKTLRKPNIPAQNRCDLAVYKLVLTVLEYAFDLPMVWTYGYTRQQLEAELDFRIEARHARQAAEELDPWLDMHTWR